MLKGKENCEYTRVRSSQYMAPSAYTLNLFFVWKGMISIVFFWKGIISIVVKLSARCYSFGVYLL
jgi:hypothetical protein